MMFRGVSKHMPTTVHLQRGSREGWSPERPSRRLEGWNFQPHPFLNSGIGGGLETEFNHVASDLINST